MKNKKYAIFVAIVAVASFILITAGVTYAFFSYMKEGTTENSIQAGSITFHYDETTKKGRGISLVDALPVKVSEETAAFLADTTDGNKFDFKITAETGTTIEMPYYITARVKDGSTLDPNLVRVYLTKVNGNSETAVLNPTNFGSLSQYQPVASRFDERVLWTETIPTGQSGANKYEQDFRLRMWLGESADYSEVPASCTYNDGTTTTDVTETYGTQALCEANGQGYTWTDAHYPLNNKTFTITVNVYSTGNVNTSGSTPTTYNASQIEYYNSSSTQCSANQTVECALDELNTLLNS